MQTPLDNHIGTHFQHPYFIGYTLTFHRTQIRVNILFLLDDIVQPGHDLGSGKRTETEPCAPGLECRNDLAQVVADHTEPHIVCELLND